MTKQLSLIASAQFLNADQLNKDSVETYNKTPENTPKHTASLFAEHCLQSVPGLTLNGGVFFVGERPVNNANEAEIGGYTTFSLGCVCIATGFIFFVEKRKKQHAKTDGQDSRVVDALPVTTVTGMIIAAVAMLVDNRLLPADMADKGAWEKAAFWGSWLPAMAHAFWRSAPVAQARLNPAWHEQCWTIALLAITAVVLNWVTTGDHFFKTIFMQTYWPVAGVDLSLLATAALSVIAARRLAKRTQIAAHPTAAAHAATDELAAARRITHG